MLAIKEVPIKYKKVNCAKCLRCYTSCPFKAISFENRKISIDIEKCQLCGICANICPADNIELIYYENKWLIDYVKNQKEKRNTENLLVVCRGSSPPSSDIFDKLVEKKVEKFIPLELPCVGRVQLDFYLHALNIGIKNIMVVQCDDVTCRFKKGSIFSSKNFQRLEELLKEVGYENGVIQLFERPKKVLYEAKDCVGCDKCEFICPYDAIVAMSLSTPKIIFEKCIGCGACSIVCPHLAIQLEGFEYEPLAQTILAPFEEVKSRKSKGISPIILVFCCKWAEFSALDKVKNSFLRKNVVLIEIPCINCLDPIKVIEAFYLDFDGVLAIVCNEDDCRAKEGREIAERNISTLKKALKNLNLTERFEICKNSPRNLGEFNLKLESFIKKIKSLPKLNLNGGENYV